MHLDHFIYVSDDPEAAAAVIRSLFGFGSVPGVFIRAGPATSSFRLRPRSP
jgi:hypothetical protein